MRSLSVLYVDDDADIRHIVALSLSLDPLIEARFAGSGEEALAMLAQGPRPDVAVLDVMMPEMDGPTLLDRMRATPGTASIPVLFMTARAREADVAAYVARGAIGVIVKPFDPLSLAAAIRGRMAAAPNSAECDQRPMTRRYLARGEERFRQLRAASIGSWRNGALR